ncbi:Adenine phosphoribosyltransferase [Apiospora marii]|uniref:Adenine phosphoribosyltransferase n=1 Tax=Apiospora marii TaxID=335849 RepID=A0ABR1RGQ9_9PEZI
MATLESLKVALREKATEATSKQDLSEAQYHDGYDVLLQGAGWQTYEEFIVPNLVQVLGPLFDARESVRVLEVGPGPKSVLGHLPYSLRRKIQQYIAYEPNELFADQLDEWLRPSDAEERPLPRLSKYYNSLRVMREPFDPGAYADAYEKEHFGLVLFCHSMYGMKPQHDYIERALEEFLAKWGTLVVFHREGSLRLDGLVCQRVALFPTGTASVADDNETLDRFSRFVTGFDVDGATQAEWREVCRVMGGREEATPGHLTFSAPEVMMVFSRNATALTMLEEKVPFLEGDRKVKSWEARSCAPTAIVRPTEIRHIQNCVRWALERGVGLTVIGGSHSAHCLRPGVVAIDMSAFNHGGWVDSPLGSRPSVGAGLWLQGGIGHLARLHGLACDSILGAVLVDVKSGEVLCIGEVPSQHRPAHSVRPNKHLDMLWAIKGAGTNFGIVVSVVFQAQPAPTYSVRNWVLPLTGKSEAQSRLGQLGERATSLPRHCSADLYLYRENDQLTLGITRIDVSTGGAFFKIDAPEFADLGPEQHGQTVDGVGLFGTEMYMSGINGGHGGGKTSSFKRCMFLKDIKADPVASILVAAIESCPSPLCYLHLLQGGGKVGDVDAESTAFGCRDWEYACVITGVWPREQDGKEVARSAVRWVYRVAHELLPSSSGVYAADLGPDPRDRALASHAFGPNRRHLAWLKFTLDPQNVLTYACPLLKVRAGPKIVVLVTGDSGAGKDYCANVWASLLSENGVPARAVSISDATKREYATATGASLDRLLGDRRYKEQHREALGAFFQRQVLQNPKLPEEHFLNLLPSTDDDDTRVLFITGMRDEAPVATLAHLRPDCRILDIRVKASKKTRRSRRGLDGGGADHAHSDDTKNLLNVEGAVGCNGHGQLPPELLQLLDEDLSWLYRMVRAVPDFPRPGVAFRHVLNIAQQPGGLTMCTNQLVNQFHGDWNQVDAVASCEAGGFVFASALAARVNVPLALIREAGKLAPPTVSTGKSQSYISSVAISDGDGSAAGGDEKRIEMDRGVFHAGASVVVVDDVLATGKTLCAVLQLLKEAGVGAENVSILVVAEFPLHRGRELLRKSGYGSAHVHSLLVFDGA